MKITKYLHSCLLVEEQGKVILLDPGEYSVKDGALKIETINQLDIIGITHEHFDHLHIPTVKALVAKFPNVQIISNESVKNILAKENISVTTTATDIVTLESVVHEKIWVGKSPENVMITLFGRLASVGDSHSFTHSPEILALPITAPWGSTTKAVEKALETKPKYIIPTHDWHWKDEVRKGMYDRLEEFFGQQGITFIKAETGISSEI